MINYIVSAVWINHQLS